MYLLSVIDVGVLVSFVNDTFDKKNYIGTGAPQ